MATLTSDSRPIIGRGPPLGARFFFLGLISIAAMVVDNRGPQLEKIREWIGLGIQPMYLVVQAPRAAWEWVAGSFADRDRLRKENAGLHEQLRVANVKLLQLESLQAENVRLRAIRTASADFGQRTLIAEIMQVDVDPFRHRVLINKGTGDGVFKGQAVIDAHGIFGQVTRAGRFASEVILISDSEHALPVQVNRNGIRSIAVGMGDLHKLTLPFLTVDADVRPNDLLVSSGLGGIYPAGYPVARVATVKRDPAETFAVVEAKPLAQLDRTREVLLIGFDQRQKAELPAGAAGPAPASRPTKTEPAGRSPTPPPSATSAQPTPAPTSTATPAPTPAPAPPATTAPPAPERTQ
ncbi:MAG TPA: rod shape-determining protein MreC [Steroidobacteraceae bacterium]|nr:rod shape-determining protein MreC [Steroidobacteraceae bacterium]